MSALPIDVIIPRDAELLSIVESYELPDKVPCGLANCRTKHKKGFVVAFRCDDGSDQQACGMIGHVCGGNNFGVGWDTVIRKFAQKKAADKAASDYALFEERAGTIIPEIRAALGTISWHTRMHEKLSEKAPEVMLICRGAVRSTNGWVSVSARREAHKLLGGSFWLGYSPVRARALVQQAAEFKIYLSGPNVSDLATARHLVNFTNIDMQWAAIKRAMAEADQALGATHLKQLFDHVNASLLDIPRPGQSKKDWHLEVRISDREFQTVEFRPDGNRGWATIAKLSD